MTLSEKKGGINNNITESETKKEIVNQNSAETTSIL